MRDLAAFQKTIWDHYSTNRRSFSWRDDISPYRVFVSEVMLQQTQAPRVAGKFDDFVTHFPDFDTLAHAPFAEILALWKGLGYNRRALALKNAARCIINEHGGIVPNDPTTLTKLPGIGQATAASIVTFAFNEPTIFIETNIRTVFINAFFSHRTDVHDREIFPLVEQTLHRESPRDWYYALMDYGVMLKKSIGNASRQSSHYHRQSRFAGSNRELRGKILDALLHHQRIAQSHLTTIIAAGNQPIEPLIKDLAKDGLIVIDNGMIRIA